MEQLRGRVALVTGASGGIGTHIARALARKGMDVAVVGRRQDMLATVADELRGLGVRAAAVPADLSDLSRIDGVVERTEDELGPVDVLVNNAGIEITASFTNLTRDEITSMVDLNLTSPMVLTHRVLPGMLQRSRGHVVFIASLAGKLGPAYSGAYGATKAGLVALTQTLRAEYLRAPVGFSVVCPGFVAGDGMYQRMVEQGIRSNRLMGETTTDRIAAATVRAIRRDVPEIVDSGAPIRPVIALNQVAPRFVERLAPRFGVTEIFRRVAAERGRAE